METASSAPGISNATPFLGNLVRAFVVSALLLHTGLSSSAENGEPPFPRLQTKSGHESLSEKRFERMREGDTIVRGAKVHVISKGTPLVVPLRRNTESELYVSLALTAPVGTEISVGQAQFRLVSVSDGACSELQYRDELTGAARWISTGIVTAIEQFEGRRLSALPLLTIRFDREAGTVDLYANGTYIRGFPTVFIKNRKLPRADLGTGVIRVHSPGGSSWLSELVQADENPIYPDGNRNGFDDEFEVALDEEEQRGALPERDTRLLWQQHQRLAPPVSLDLNRPSPDSLQKGEQK